MLNSFVFNLSICIVGGARRHRPGTAKIFGNADTPFPPILLDHCQGKYNIV